LELGCGDFSTPLLHALCALDKRYLLSTDCDKAWLSLFLDLETDWHRFQYVPVYESDARDGCKKGGHPERWDSIGNDMHWAVVFIDHSPAKRRVKDIVRLRSSADVMVIHDTQPCREKCYKYGPVLSTFKYRYVYERYAVQTTIVSDVYDCASWLK
jgi:hypothetical protein